MERIVRDVPDSRVNFVVATVESDGGTVTKKNRQGDGLWTIICKFPGPAGPNSTAAEVPPSPKPEAPAPSSVSSHSRDVDILARTIWGEARSEDQLGREAVAAVVLNRLKRDQPQRFGTSVAEVCMKSKQFSCWNSGDPNLQKLKRVDDTDHEFRVCIEIAERAVSGILSDPTKGSDHYHTHNVSPTWSKEKQAVVVIGMHKFYNNIA